MRSKRSPLSIPTSSPSTSKCPASMDLETLRCIMAQFPRPVIMVSSVNRERRRQNLRRSRLPAPSTMSPNNCPPPLSTSFTSVRISSPRSALPRHCREGRLAGSLSRKPPAPSRRRIAEHLTSVSVDRRHGNFHRRPQSTAGNTAPFPPDFSVPDSDRAAHARGLHRAFRPTAEYSLLRHRPRSGSPRPLRPAWSTSLLPACT